ncbi:hypothetical protein N8J89_15390 [Crossiella sp. CA-258035]|uniref:hypothetical protein n=1 Tax=Crossiella sp. CA-258035 TaxID=2981138 RepID=UPI0024BC7A77|nr:hypothetical protein [Crossiella sp. CA-258035]WHT22394.1 hypothetical protein N8J89_15390 [Crossiella sp. CA-258035]
MRALLLCGPRGVGKSVVAWAVYAHLARAGQPAAYLDLAQLGFCRPDQGSVKARNLATAWRTFQATGTRYLVLSGEVGEPATLDAYAAALGDVPLTVCRLHADQDRLTERLLARSRGEGPPIPGDDLRGKPPAELRRLAAAASHPPLGDLCLDSTDRSVPEVAELVRAAWLGD